MSDLLATGAEWLRGQLTSFASQTVSVTRSGTTISVSASRGQTKTESIDGDGMTVEGKQIDWLIDAADYDFGAGAVEPAEGDEIRDTASSGTVYVFTVLPLGAEKAWRWSDPYRKKLRIHTKQTATE